MAGLTARAKALVYANLEKYARSGMGMEKACQSLLVSPGIPAAERRVYEGLAAGLRGGKSIGDALGSVAGIVTPLEHEVVVAAESGGRLELGFRHLAEYFRRVDRARRRILKGLAYPLVLVHFAIPVSTLASTAFRNFSPDAKAPAALFREALTQSGWTMLVIWLGVLLATGGLVWLGRLGRVSPGIDAFLGTIPWLGRARRALAMERFSQVFEIFLLAGRTMSDSLDGAARASGSGRILKAGKRGAALVVSGEPLATALRAGGRAYPEAFVRGMAAAEESGQLDRELAEWGNYYSETAAEAMESLAEWTPKLFYWGILLFVATLIIRAALAYRDLIESLLNLGG
jgi:type IV pilus assembly protein PilC